MQDLKQLEEKYRALGEEIQTLKDRQDEEWKPKKGDPYYTPLLGGFRDNLCIYFEVEEVDTWYSNQGLMFETEEHAIRSRDKLLLLARMEKRVRQLNQGWLPDWSNNDQVKYGILYRQEILIVDYYRSNNSFIFGLVVQNRKQAETLLDEFGDRIDALYGNNA